MRVRLPIGRANDFGTKNAKKNTENIYLELQIVDLQQNVAHCMETHAALFHLRSFKRLMLLFFNFYDTGGKKTGSTSNNILVYDQPSTSRSFGGFTKGKEGKKREHRKNNYGN